METMPILFLLNCLLLLTKTPTEAHSILCNEGERSTLLSLRSELVFDSLRSTKLVAWNSHNDCCRWDGIECDSIGRVIGLELDYDGISSGINGSSSLFRLRNLKKLSLADNTLDEGIQIPKEIGRLTSLTELDLSGAGFGGPIPSTFGELRELAVVDLSQNLLTGPIPSSFTELRGLVSLDLSDNMFTNLASNRLEGSLSNSQLKGLPALQILDLSHNRFSGRIPHSIFRLPSLQRLYLSHNRFCGPPEEGLDVEGSDEEEEIGWGYVSASLRFAVGLGVILWASMCNRTFMRVSRRVDVALDDFFDSRARQRRRTVVRQINLGNRSLRNWIAPAAVA